jgi:hypothetical protein
MSNKKHAVDDITARRARVRQIVLALLGSDFWMTKYYDGNDILAAAAMLDHRIETMQFQIDPPPQDPPSTGETT